MLLGSLVIVFFTMGLLGLIRPDSGPRRVETRQRIRKRAPAKSMKSSMAPIDDDEDIHIEGEDDPVVDVQADLGGVDVVPEEVTVALDNFESRLQRLREHRERIGDD
jgi:hypothetical protein